MLLQLSVRSGITVPACGAALGLCGAVCAPLHGGTAVLGSWLSLWDVEQSQKPRLCLNP